MLIVKLKGNYPYYTGASTNGGGGGGGRIAIYHTKDNNYGGAFTVHGGSGVPQYGGAGTIYLATNNGTETIYDSLITDNGGFTSSQRINEVPKLTLDGANTSTTAMSFTTFSGLTVTTNGTVYSYGCGIHTCYRSFNHLRGDSEYYQSSNHDATITIALPFVTYIDHIRIHPQCSR